MRTGDCPPSAPAVHRRSPSESDRSAPMSPAVDTNSWSSAPPSPTSRSRRLSPRSSSAERRSQRVGAVLTRVSTAQHEQIGDPASARAMWRSSSSAVGSAHWRSSSIKTNGRAVDIRRKTSAAASNVRNRSVASSDSVGAGVVSTRVETSGRCGAAHRRTARRVRTRCLPEHVFDARGEHAPERLQRNAGLVATSVHDGRTPPTRRAVLRTRQGAPSCRSRAPRRS